MESIRGNFFNRVEGSIMKMSWIGWTKVLVFKDKEGLGVSNLFALNCSLLFKRVWRFITKKSSLLPRFVKVIHGVRGALDNSISTSRLLALTHRNQAPGVVKPEIGGNVNFEIKSQFMRELREDTFSGNKNDDAYEHVERFLNIVSLFNILGVTHDAVMLRVFPITLTRAAKRYYPPSSMAKQLKEIHNFKQEGDKTLYQAWERSTSRRVSNDSLSRIAAIINKLDSLRRDMKKLKENVHAIQIGCPLGYYTHVDNRPPFGEKKPSLEELMNKHIKASTQKRAEMEEWMKKLQESIELNTRNQNAS
ncbi:hypothetical protein Tco_0651941 [Tanacetum coccineum]|uniref:Uncharacterized protein n=1 Tax=Tanacetum coccineum TaxID=301880 RepID=A0ABQ4WW85_9ASTR